MRPFLSSFIAFFPVAFCQYVLNDDYTAGVFADNFNFFTGNDPTNGYVNYLSQTDAVNAGLLRTNNDGSIYMGVDDTNVATGRGRNSIRIESKKIYNHGLFILDLAHMPGGQCGSWPAYWLKGPQAPAYSELDIIEGINLDTTSLMSVKTNQACSIGQQAMTGTLKTTDCNLNTAGLVGCSIDSTSPATYGTGFNSLGGGVYATEWTSQGITIWYFPRSAIPADITAGTPNPQLWGLPLSKFVPDCRLDDNFYNQNIVMNIDFCGDYAGSPFFYNQNPTCTAQAATCNDFVQNNPGAFTETYWRINQLKVYQFSTASTTSSSTSSPSPVPVSTTSGSSMTISTTSYSSDTTTSPSYTFWPGSVTQPSSSTILPIAGSTTTSSFFVYTGLPPQPTTSSIPIEVSTMTSSSSPSEMSTTTMLSSSAGPIVGSTTNDLSSQSTVGPLLGSTSTSSSQYLTSSSSFQVDPNLGSSTSTSPYVGWTTSGGLISTSPKPTSPSSKTTHTSVQSNDGGWGGHGVSSTVITTTLKGTWVEPCPTGLTTRTTTFVTTHCGCTKEPLPTFSLTTTTITCPADWPITTPFVVVRPVRPQPTGHEVIVTTDHGGKTITITGPIIPTQTVVVPVTVVPLPPASPNMQGPPGAPSAILATKTRSLANSDQGHGLAGSSAPTAPVNAPGAGMGPGGSDNSGYQVNGNDAGNNVGSSNGHQNGGTGSGGSGDNVDSNGGSNDQGGAAPTSSSWVATYTGAAATVVASSTLLMFLFFISFIFLELSVV